MPPTLIKRSKVHFCTLSIGVDLILGMNGYVWIRQHTPEPTMEQIEADADALYGDVNDVRAFLFLPPDAHHQRVLIA